MTYYEIVKYIHVVLAIIAIGFNISYAVWLRRAAKDPEHTAYILRGIKFLDDRLASPAYALLLVTGFLMVWEIDIPLDTFWIAGGLVLYGLLIVGGLIFYTPVLRKQTELAESGRADTDEYRSLAGRGMAVGVGLVIVVLAIEFLMVTKPT